jgi:hypothetical protein
MKGRTLVFIADKKNEYYSMDDPYTSVGELSGGKITISRKANVLDGLGTLPDRGGEPETIAGAMDRKIAELGGDFSGFRGEYSEDEGWSYFVLTTKSFDWDKGKFWGKDLAKSGKGAGPKGPPQKMVYKVDGSSDAAVPDMFPVDDKIGDISLHRQRIDAERHYAAYTADDGTCGIRWVILGADGKPAAGASPRMFLVSGGKIAAPGDPCRNADQFEVQPLKISGEIHDLHGRWEDAKFGIWNQATSDNDKNDAAAFLGWVVTKK